MAMPARGDSKIRSWTVSGSPTRAVGQPPITRWDYREFSVYFERDRVINSVRHHQRAQPPVKEDQQP